MKILYNIVVFGLLISCNGEHPHQDHTAPKATKVNQPTLAKADITSQSTLIVNGLALHQTIKNDRPYCMVLGGEDTIVKPEDFYTSIEVIDIDLDGSLDLRVYINSNTPNDCDTYFFDKKAERFVKIEGASFLIEKIPGTEYYHNYARTGCNDMNWESHLGVIKNQQMIPCAYMLGTGCEDAKPREIKVFNCNDSGQMNLTETLPYSRWIKENGDKWDFIEAYWKKNCNKFPPCK